VVVCSEGYPGKVRVGQVIEGVETADSVAGPGEEVVIFHAGTSRDSSGALVTTGGRVLGVTALAADLGRAQALATAAAARIRFPGAFFRRDIGHRVLGATRQQGGATSRQGQQRHPLAIAGLECGVAIDIHQLEAGRRIQSLEALQQPLAKATTLPGEQQQMHHQSGTGSQPQGVNGWQRSNRRRVSPPPRQAPWRRIASRP
jgi:hypothetical protein